MKTSPILLWEFFQDCILVMDNLSESIANRTMAMFTNYRELQSWVTVISEVTTCMTVTVFTECSRGEWQWQVKSLPVWLWPDLLGVGEVNDSDKWSWYDWPCLLGVAEVNDSDKWSWYDCGHVCWVFQRWMTVMSEVTASNYDWPCVKGVTGVNDSVK